MTDEQKKKAANMLLQEDGILLGDRCYIPKVFMVGMELCITFYSALRQQKNHYIITNEKLAIEEFTINDAWKFINQEELPIDMDKRVDWNYNSNGDKGDNETIFPWQFMMNRHDARVKTFLHKPIKH